MYLNLILLLVFFAVFASTIQNGLWSNMVLLINVVSSGLVATNYYEPVAELFDDFLPAWGVANDIVSVWLVFAGTMGVLSLVTDQLSKVKVRFIKPLDRYGGIALSCWIAWVMVCFTTMTLHTAPLPRNFAGGDFQPDPAARMLFGMAPDHRWLGFVQKLSRGVYSTSPMNMFDPRADFILKYAQRRAGVENGGSWDAPGPAKAAAAKRAGGVQAAPAAEKKP
ncbi:MAG TPA: CvpA family protein [Pirellulales bacterium]|nr:CvpA family protein [Pirellulales bacterium]